MIYRLPNPNTRWVWEIDQPLARALIEVVKVQFNGEEWWVTTVTLPEAPTPMFGHVEPARMHENEVDRFWEAVTPVGGRIEDLSVRCSPEQYAARKD